MFETPDGYRLWHSIDYCFAMVPGLLIGLVGFAIDTPDGGCVRTSGVPVVIFLSPFHLLLLTFAAFSVFDRPGYRVNTLLGMSAAPYAIIGAYSAFAATFNYRPAPLLWFEPSVFGVTLPTMQFAVTCMVFAGLCLIVPSLPISISKQTLASQVSRCRNCDYDMRGLPGDVCPECGFSASTSESRKIRTTGSRTRDVRIAATIALLNLLAGLLAVVTSAMSPFVLIATPAMNALLAGRFGSVTGRRLSSRSGPIHLAAALAAPLPILTLTVILVARVSFGQAFAMLAAELALVSGPFFLGCLAGARSTCPCLAPIGVCGHCRYELTGLDSRICPECGNETERH